MKWEFINHMTTELFSLSVQQLPVGCVHVYSAVIPSFFFSFFSSLKFSMQTCACPVLTIFECFNLFSGTSKIKQRKPNSSLCGLICVCLWVCGCVCVCERERERERESLLGIGWLVVVLISLGKGEWVLQRMFLAG